VAGGCGAGAQIDVGVLTGVVPPQLLDEVIEVAGCRERRRRLLPARVVVYAVLGLALFHAGDGFRPPGYRAVMRMLVGAGVVGVVVASAAALCLARKRLGSTVFALLFERVAGLAAIGGPVEAGLVCGRRVVLWDGTEIGVPDSAENAAEFGYRGQDRDRTQPVSAAERNHQGSTPMLRLMMLIDAHSHAVIDAGFDASTRADELDLARGLIASLRPGMLLVADRYFLGYEMWSLAVGSGADLLWRAKANRVFHPVKHLADGSYLALLPTPAETRRCGSARKQRLATHAPRHGLLVRVIDYTITVTAPDGSSRTETFRLVTTLLDADLAPVQQLAACYHQRWGAETGYSFLKPRLIGTTTSNILRSRTPEGITQEIFAFLIVYQLLCQLRAQAAATDNCPPAAISFLVTLRAARASIGHHPHQQHDQVIAAILAEPKLKQRNRTSPRKIRPRRSKYLTKDRDAPASTHIAYQIEIQPRAA
jgi:hypothetical protein